MDEAVLSQLVLLADEIDRLRAEIDRLRASLQRRDNTDSPS
jgi:uncharacterized small protein (DUF1192 family)